MSIPTLEKIHRWSVTSSSIFQPGQFKTGHLARSFAVAKTLHIALRHRSRDVTSRSNLHTANLSAAVGRYRQAPPPLQSLLELSFSCTRILSLSSPTLLSPMAHFLLTTCLTLFLCASAATSLSRRSSRVILQQTPRNWRTRFASRGTSASLEAGFTPAGEFQCTPELAFLRPGGTFNNPNATLTESPLQCCRLCFDDTRCLTWSRDRRDGRCFLMLIVPPLMPNPDFDSGALEGVDAQATVPATRCEVVRGIFYPNGRQLEQRRARGTGQCCERCRRNSECFSWHFHRPTRNCVLNGNTPGAISNSEYNGNSII